MVNKITKTEKNRYELLSLEWTRKQTEEDKEGANALKEELLRIENELGMTAEEIVDSTPDK